MIIKRDKVNKNRKKISEKLERKFFIFYSCTIQLSKMIRKKKKIFRTKHADNMPKRTLVISYPLFVRPTVRHKNENHTPYANDSPVYPYFRNRCWSFPVIHFVVRPTVRHKKENHTPYANDSPVYP